MFFSIIIPIYNAEEYLNRCLSSLLIQEFDDFEIILINDGSTDDSLKICNDFLAQSKRKSITVFNKINEGVSIARNKGIELSKGEWILFLDADDWVEKRWLSDLVDLIKQNDKIEIFHFGFNKVSSDGVVFKYIPENKTLSVIDFLVVLNYNIGACGYVFKNEIVEKYKLKFPEHLKVSEDIAFVLTYLSVVRKIRLINKEYYNYFTNVSSATSVNTIENCICNLYSANFITEFCVNNGINENFYVLPVKYLYESFFLHIFLIKHLNVRKTNRLYRNEYLRTLNFYADFKKISSYRIAYFHIYLFKVYRNFKTLINAFK